MTDINVELITKIDSTEKALISLSSKLDAVAASVKKVNENQAKFGDFSKKFKMVEAAAGSLPGPIGEIVGAIGDGTGRGLTSSLAKATAVGVAGVAVWKSTVTVMDAIYQRTERQIGAEEKYADVLKRSIDAKRNLALSAEGQRGSLNALTNLGGQHAVDLGNKLTASLGGDQAGASGITESIYRTYPSQGMRDKIARTAQEAAGMGVPGNIIASSIQGLGSVMSDNPRTAIGVMLMQSGVRFNGGPEGAYDAVKRRRSGSTAEAVTEMGKENAKPLMAAQESASGHGVADAKLKAAREANPDAAIESDFYRQAEEAIQKRQANPTPMDYVGSVVRALNPFDDAFISPSELAATKERHNQYGDGGILTQQLKTLKQIDSSLKRKPASATSE